jgi:serine phosphatase RsbU (regulator of sigma subunit)
MAADSPLIVVGAQPALAPLKAMLSRAGIVHETNAIDGPDPAQPERFGGCLIDAFGAYEAAKAFARRWRGRPGAELVPTLWICDTAEREAGFACGADCVLARPFRETELVAAVQSLHRRHRDWQRLAEKSLDFARVNETLRQVYQQVDRDFEMARRIQRTLLPAKLPVVGQCRFAVAYRPRHGGGGDFYHVSRLDEERVGFYIGDVIGHHLGACLLAIYLRLIIVQKEISGQTYRLPPVDEVLQRLNQDLSGLNLQDPSFVRLTVGVLNATTGELTYGCAGHTPPLFLPANGPPELWRAYGSMLGVAESQHPPQTARLRSGDRLLLFTDGLHGTGQGTASAMLAAVNRHRDRALDALVEFLTADLFASTTDPDDFTMLAIEVR